MDILLGTEMQDHYIELSMECDYIVNRPTAWKFENGKLNLLSGY